VYRSIRGCEIRWQIEGRGDMVQEVIQRAKIFNATIKHRRRLNEYALPISRQHPDPFAESSSTGHAFASEQQLVSYFLRKLQREPKPSGVRFTSCLRKRLMEWVKVESTSTVENAWRRFPASVSFRVPCGRRRLIGRAGYPIIIRPSLAPDVYSGVVIKKIRARASRRECSNQLNELTTCSRCRYSTWLNGLTIPLAAASTWEDTMPRRNSHQRSL